MLACGERLARVVHVLAELGIADLVADGTNSVIDLAAKSGSHTDSLYRVLRCAASVGIFREEPQQTFQLTPLACGLLSSHPNSVLPLVKYNNLDVTRRPYNEMLHSVRTGEPVLERTFGIPFYQYLREEPEIGAFFERFMMHWSRRMVHGDFKDLTFPGHSTLVDIGGSDGYFLANLLSRQPELRGFLIDLPNVVANAPTVLREHGVLDRATLVPGNFFEVPLPTGCDIYLIKAVLHNWSDEMALALLRRVRRTIGDTDARLTIIDQVLPPPNQLSHGRLLDMDMLVLFGGRERTLEEWTRMLESAGFQLNNRPGHGWALLECLPGRFDG
ncbi:O-methyltransferase [Amycolatopsis panacis]|uniref:O-methyltransferase n=1 Tax=Amycolatopsis panacis TaxID=2340917 RepID=A0A419HX88_9PSEU|nr:O-methyltransferase [Amycolatopsis panacis]